MTKHTYVFCQLALNRPAFKSDATKSAMRIEGLVVNATTTLPQAIKILEMLKDIPLDHTQKALETGFLSDVLKTGEIDTIYQRMMRQEFERMCHLVEKTVEPQDLIVTRPHNPDTYHRDPSRNGKYQMRFWKKKMGFIKSGGHVSDGGGSNGLLLFEYYSSQPQGLISYPNEAMDLSLMYQRRGRKTDYRWHKETIEKFFYDGSKEAIDVFTLKIPDDAR